MIISSLKICQWTTIIEESSNKLYKNQKHGRMVQDKDICGIGENIDDT
jgi:hypothetical protein